MSTNIVVAAMLVVTLFGCKPMYFTKDIRLESSDLSFVCHYYEGTMVIILSNAFYGWKDGELGVFCSDSSSTKFYNCLDSRDIYQFETFRGDSVREYIPCSLTERVPIGFPAYLFQVGDSLVDSWGIDVRGFKRFPIQDSIKIAILNPKDLAIMGEGWIHPNTDSIQIKNEYGWIAKYGVIDQTDSLEFELISKRRGLFKYRGVVYNLNLQRTYRRNKIIGEMIHEKWYH